MLGVSFGGIEVSESVKNLYRDSKLTKIQEFYWLSFKELFNKEAMETKGISDEDLEYVLANRDVEFARRDTESWEMRANLFKTKEWKELKDFYGINESDIRNVEVLKSKGLNEEQINFITGKVGEITDGTVETKQSKKWAKK